MRPKLEDAKNRRERVLEERRKAKLIDKPMMAIMNACTTLNAAVN